MNRRKRVGQSVGLGLCCASLLLISSAAAQQNPALPATPALPAPTVPEQAPTAADAPAPTASPSRAATTAGKKSKSEYTGPTTVVELPPTPVLDEEGRQRLDPDGKPMFNPPIRQIRDKKGHPVFDENGKPVFQTAKDLGYDERGKKIEAKRDKEPKTVEITVTHGTFSVDGMTAKAGLNYEIKDFRYVYLYVPWIGTTVVSNAPFPGSKEQKDAFNDKTLTITVEDHTLQLYSDARLLEKKPQPAYVLVDREYKLPTSRPVVGYGATNHAPYSWPGSKDNKAVAGTDAPPLPENMKPQMLLAPCPAGQMRAASAKPLPGQTAAEQPCVPIARAIAPARSQATPPQ